jgi:hypothetical protein
MRLGTFNRICEITKTGLCPLYKTKLFFVYKSKTEKNAKFKIFSHAVDAIFDDVKYEFILNNANDLNFVKSEFNSLTNGCVDPSIIQNCLTSNKILETSGYFVGVYPILSLLADSFVELEKQSHLITSTNNNINEDLLREYNWNENTRQLEELKHSIESKTKFPKQQTLTDEEKILSLKNENKIIKSMSTECVDFISLTRMIGFFGIKDGINKYIEALSINYHLNSSAYSLEPSFYLTQGHYGQVEHFEAVLSVLKEISEDH